MLHATNLRQKGKAFADANARGYLGNVAGKTDKDRAKLGAHKTFVLFVGRVTPSKAQDELIAAFDLFRHRIGRPSRLVLVGALDPDDHLYLDALQARIDGEMAGVVQLTGLVPDEELHDCYRQADLYVSLSHHEGFGVPLVEALAHGVPVSSAAEVAACRTIAAEAGVPVEWHTGYVSLDEQQALLAGCDVLVLPYQPSKESSSAALRSVLATGIPTAFTQLPLVEEAGNAVFRLPGTNPAAIAEGLFALLADTPRRAPQIVLSAEWLADRATLAVARRLHAMLFGLVEERRMALVNRPLSDRYQPFTTTAHHPFTRLSAAPVQNSPGACILILCPSVWVKRQPTRRHG